MNQTMKHLYTLQIVIQVGSMTPYIQVIGSIQGTIRDTCTITTYIGSGRGGCFAKKHIFFNDLFLALKTIK